MVAALVEGFASTGFALQIEAELGLDSPLLGWFVVVPAPNVLDLTELAFVMELQSRTAVPPLCYPV